MQAFSGKKIIVILILIVAITASAIIYFTSHKKPQPLPAPVVIVTPKNTGPVHEVIGSSVEGRAIDAYTYGSGDKQIVFAGGMHGGYEWNSVLLAYKFMDYLAANPEAVPSNEKITVIPSINPDGVFEVTGKEGRFAVSDVSTSSTILAAGRFNADDVDLNRNFGCNWQSKSTWQNKTVSAGTSAFSEPEAQAIRNFAEKNKPDAFVFWHSQADAVYASECNDGILPGTLDIMTAYAKAAGYPAVKSFDAYKVTGDSEGWLASIGIPAITVELKTHNTIEWDQNLAGIKALLKYFGQ